MDGRTMRTLAEYITELHRRDRDHNGTTECPAFDTTIEDDAHWDQGNRGRDGRCSQDHTGQSGDNIPGQHSSTGQ